MASSWRYGKYRAKVSQDPEDYYRLDPKKSSAENCYDIYTALCCRDTRDTKRLFLLNGLATLCQQQQQQLQKLQQQQQQQSQKYQQQQQQQILSKSQQHNTSTQSAGSAAASTSSASLATTSATHTMPSAITKTTTATTSVAALKLVAATAKSNLGFTTEELLYCLSASLIHTFTQVRAAALRTIRYALANTMDIKVFNSMQLPHLLCRSIDLMLKNDDERVQALKLIRKMLAISPEDINPVLLRCLVSLADTGIEDSDNMLRACLATLCEFAVLNPTLLICCGGVTSITRNVLECHNPRIAESLSGVLLYLLERPHTRNLSGVRLDCLAAPYCDFTYRLGIMDKNKDARELRYTSCRLALLSVLRSWTGTIEFCDPSKPSGLKAIVDSLYLNQIEVRKAILELLYELLGLPQPTWTEDYSVALQSVDPSDFQDNWLLSNGFVAAEGRSILPSLAARAPNICEQHLALQLYCFLETGLLTALVEVIVSSEVSTSVAATVLIGKLIHLMHTHLPADICSASPALPTLISHATQGNQHASAAVSALQCYQKMLRNRPASSSLFLDSIIQEGTLIHTRLFRREINAQDLPLSSALQSPPNAIAGSVNQNTTALPFTSIGGGTLERQRLDSVSSSDESNSQSSSTRRASFRLKCKFLPFLENIKVNRLIKDSNVMQMADGVNWDWEVISTILRSNFIRKFDDNNQKFLKNLIEYFKPSKNLFSHQEFVHNKSLPAYVTVGLDLIDWLLASYPLESTRLLTDFFSDVAVHLLAVTTSNRAHDCLFSPQHMNNTMCQQYFLYIGRMCRVQKGISILTNTAVFEYLINLVRNTDHVCYVKLIVSGLDYTLDSVTRKVLETALTSAKTRSGRLYATQFLMVLLRARIPNFEVWGIPLIIQQTKDADRSVVLAAMDVLEEACHEKYYLEEIVSLWPNLKHLGDVGRVLMARYYSLSRGLNQPKARIKEEIEYWKNGYNKRYILLVEADAHSSLTLHIRNEDGYYSRRNCNTRPTIIPPNIPAHLYGQMVQTAQGTTALRKYGDLPQLMEIIVRGKCSDEQECLELKSALWAVGHASTHSNGIEFFMESGTRIYEKLVQLASKCEVYSIRSTCFNVLGLIGGTSDGANLLFKLNWLSVRHDRNTIWPVHQPEDWMLGNYTPVRHHYEDMPPYNYTGLEDQIDGSYYTGSYWNLLLSSTSTNRDITGYGGGGGAASASSEAQDANTTTDSIKTSGEEVGIVGAATTITGGGVGGGSGTSVVATPAASSSNSIIPNSAKSKTLPEGSYLRHGKHQRSLSESKTTDVISLLSSGTGGNMPFSSSALHHSHRTRYNSCTDSNTSGVSSCESVTGRAAAAMGDFQQFPLSPIPSMSNLLEIPMGQSSFLRRNSLVGGPSYLQSSLSPVDIKGYAQLRSLRRHCRPVLSESAAELYDIVDRMELYASFRPRKSSFGESSRKMKVRSLDRQASLRMYAHFNEEEVQVPLPSLAAPKFLTQNDSKGPCYTGICLPKNLLDIFPTRNLNRTYVSQDIQDQDLMDINLLTAKQQMLNDSLNNEAGDESSVISSLSDVSSVSKQRSKWTTAGAGSGGGGAGTTKHGRSSCLQCTRLRKTQRTQSRLDGAGGDVASSTTTLCEMYTNASAALVAAGIQATVALSRKGGGGGGVPAAAASATGEKVTASTNKPPAPHLTHQQYSNASSIQLSELQFQSPESILSEDSLPDKLTANILYNVQRLANPVSAKQSKLALLELKQKHPKSFQDICLYSEVCKTLGRCSYRMNARRFLQELFLDLDFDTFYNEPLEILGKKDKNAFKREDSHRDHMRSGTAASHHQHHSGTTQDKVLMLKERMKRDLTLDRGGGLELVDASTLGSGKADLQSPSSSGVNNSGFSMQKPHLKSQPLASVYEASCENLLLDPSPRQKSSAAHNTTTRTNPNTSSSCSSNTVKSSSMHVKQNCKNFTMAPPPAAPPPNSDMAAALIQDFTTELRITSDDDDDDDEGDGDDDEEEDFSPNNHRQPQQFHHRFRSPPKQKPTSADQVDGGAAASSSAASSSTLRSTSLYSLNFNPASSSNNPSNTIANSLTNCSGGSGTAVSTPLSSNCSSDHTNSTATTSNRSSLCTVISRNNSSNTPAAAAVTPPSNSPPKKSLIENENTKYRRGRFYTLELDLSCTKNKFPITNRSTKAAAAVSTAANSAVCFNPAVTVNQTSPLGSSNTSSTTTTSTSATAAAAATSTNNTCSSSLLRQHSLGSNSSNNYKLPVSRLSYTAGGLISQTTASNIPHNAMQTTTVTTGTLSSISTATPCSSSAAATNLNFCITKSLAASLAQPIGTLYCEKRLQSSKSEAVLLQQNTSITTTNSTSSATSLSSSSSSSAAKTASKVINLNKLKVDGNGIGSGFGESAAATAGIIILAPSKPNSNNNKNSSSNKS